MSLPNLHIFNSRFKEFADIMTPEAIDDDVEATLEVGKSPKTETCRTTCRSIGQASVHISKLFFFTNHPTRKSFETSKPRKLLRHMRQEEKCLSGHVRRTLDSLKKKKKKKVETKMLAKTYIVV